MYAYNKNSGSLKWAYKNNYKTTVPVFVAGNIIYAAASKNEEPQAVQISLTDGKLIKELTFGPMQTKSMVKNGIRCRCSCLHEPEQVKGFVETRTKAGAREYAFLFALERIVK